MEYLGSKRFIGFFAAILITISAFVFQNPNNQSINWTFPYFSGAANFSRLFDWRISPPDFEAASQLSVSEYRSYRHQATDETVTNTVNNYGYILVALVAQKLFGFLGDLDAAIVLQFIVHLFVCLFLILAVLNTTFQRYGFLFLYAANPIIVHFVTFPFYYFWLFIPAAAFVTFYLKPEWRYISVILSVPFVLFSLLIRPTTILLCLYLYFLAWRFAKSRQEKLVAAGAFIVFAFGVLIIAGQNTGSPYHPMYVGIGAYQNQSGVKSVSDDEGFKLFVSKTGLLINTHATLGNWNDPIIRNKYNDVLKEKYLEVLKEHSAQLFGNALLNMTQAFSVGHDVDRPWINYFSSLVGTALIILFIGTGQWVFLFGIFFSALGYAWYFPPIPAYHFGEYILLTLGLIFGLEKIAGSVSSEKLELIKKSL